MSGTVPLRGWRRGLARVARFAGCVLLVAVAGCAAETGPVAVEKVNGKVTPFPGLANLLNDLPAGGSLNIFVAHGMATSADESEQNLRASIADRLKLTQVGGVEQRRLLPTIAPKVTVDGASIWPTGYDTMSPGWQCPAADPNLPLDKCDAPYLDIARYQAADGGKKVVFYSLNYWGVLVWMKCNQLVSADTRLIGDLSLPAFIKIAGNAAYCNDRFKSRFNSPIPTQSVSTPALLLDQGIKDYALDWGFPDAIIVTSGYRRVLHLAVREALMVEGADVVSRFRRAGEVGAVRRFMARNPAVAQCTGQQGCGGAALDDADLNATQKYAVITESLGSYVVLDALAWATDLTRASPEAIICRASQIHMLANQETLLRLSRMRVRLGEKSVEGREGEGSAPQQVVTCPGDAGPAPYVVGYHDPSDLLTFYMYHPPAGAQYSFEQRLRTQMISVVAPFGPEWLNGFMADPVNAHSAGQEKDTRIQDMVSYGSDGTGPNGKLAPDLGPPPGPMTN